MGKHLPPDEYFDPAARSRAPLFKRIAVITAIVLAGGIAVLAAHPGDTGGHAGGELAHGRGGDRGHELIPVGEVPVGGVGHHAHHLCRLTEHDGIRAAGPGQFQPRGDQSVADGAARTAPPGPGYRTC